MSSAVLICPVCGGENSHDAVFCENPACRKALGEFRYVMEEIPRSGWHHRLADRFTRFMGAPHFLAGHFVWFALWVVLNSGLVLAMHAFDPYPFGFLGIILTAEAIFISGCVLVTQSRQAEQAEKRAELDYEVNVRSYRHILALSEQLKELSERLARLEGRKED